MQIRLRLLMSTAIMAALSGTAFGQGLGYPEAPDPSVTRAARYWCDAGYLQRLGTGHVGFLATNGCDNKPICSVCDYSRARVCGCDAGHGSVFASFASWFTCGPLDCASPKGGSKKGAPQKCVSQKAPIQKYAPQKCVSQKAAKQKFTPQKLMVQKAPTQKCSKQKSVKSCGCAPKCSRSCGPSLMDSITSRVSSLGRTSFACKSKSGCGSKSAGKSNCGSDGPPVMLPFQMQDHGDVVPHSEGPEFIDPSEPPQPMLDGGASIGTGVRSAETFERGTWRRSRPSQGSMPRLLPSGGSGRDVSRISYEELIESKSTQGENDSNGNPQLDVFQAATKIDKAAAQAAPSRSSTAVGELPKNPLR